MNLFLSLLFNSTNLQTPPLENWKWKNRVLIVCAPFSSSVYSSQLDELMKVPGSVPDRDIIILGFHEDSVRNESSNGLAPVALDLKKYYNLTNEFRVILIGKDGGIKLDKRSPVTSEEVFKLIDSMPMRKQEISRKRKKQF